MSKWHHLRHLQILKISYTSAEAEILEEVVKDRKDCVIIGQRGVGRQQFGSVWILDEDICSITEQWNFDEIIKTLKESDNDDKELEDNDDKEEIENNKFSLLHNIGQPIFMGMRENPTIQELPKYKNDKKLKQDMKAQDNLVDMHDSSKIKERLRRKLKKRWC